MSGQSKSIKSLLRFPCTSGPGKQQTNVQKMKRAPVFESCFVEGCVSFPFSVPNSHKPNSLVSFISIIAFLSSCPAKIKPKHKNASPKALSLEERLDRPWGPRGRLWVPQWVCRARSCIISMTFLESRTQFVKNSSLPKRASGRN